VEQGMPASNGTDKRGETRHKIHNYLKHGPYGKEWMEGPGKDWLFGDED
jgi:hypothetical protein